MLTLISNRHLCGERDFIDVIEVAIQSGVSRVIFREKDATAIERMAWTKRLLKSNSNNKCSFIVHSDINIAALERVNGIHITMDALSTFSSGAELKELCHKENDPCFEIGVSVHSLEEAKQAEAFGASYILAGHIFKTDCKKGLEGRGLDYIKAIVQAADIPVIGLGGINPDNMKSVLDIGASEVAVMSGIMSADDIELAVGSFIK